MLPVPFVTGNLRYDAIFIASYVCWILFELVTGSSRKARGAAKAQDRGSFFFFDRDDLAGNVSGFYVLLWSPAGGDSLETDGDFLYRDCADMDWNCVSVLLHAGAGQVFHV